MVDITFTMAHNDSTLAVDDPKTEWVVCSPVKHDPLCDRHEVDPVANYPDSY